MEGRDAKFTARRGACAKPHLALLTLAREPCPTRALEENRFDIAVCNAALQARAVVPSTAHPETWRAVTLLHALT
jgi:hypothetical protein